MDRLERIQLELAIAESRNAMDAAAAPADRAVRRQSRNAMDAAAAPADVAVRRQSHINPMDAAGAPADRAVRRQNMWPHGVMTNHDMYLFARLIVGPRANLEDCSRSRLPGEGEDAFLYVSRGGCQQGTRFDELANCVPDMMEELIQFAQDIGNMTNPANAYVTGSPGSYSWFDSAQLCRSNCTCRINMGGEGRSSTRRRLNPDCQQWTTGRRLELVLLDIVQRNSLQPGVGCNVYMRKAFHAMLTRIRHSDHHCIDWHYDEAPTYVPEDPITTLNWGATGVVLIRSRNRWNREVKVLVARPGDVYIFGGAFQQQFEYAEPPLRDWPDILERYRSDLQPNEIQAMAEEMRLGHVDGHARVRYHINLRWHTNHFGDCTPTWRPEAPVDASRQLFGSETAQRLGGLTVGAMRTYPFFTLGTRASAFQGDNPQE